MGSMKLHHLVTLIVVGADGGVAVVMWWRTYAASPATQQQKINTVGELNL